MQVLIIEEDAHCFRIKEGPSTRPKVNASKYLDESEFYFLYLLVVGVSVGITAICVLLAQENLWNEFSVFLLLLYVGAFIFAQFVTPGRN